MDLINEVFNTHLMLFGFELKKGVWYRYINDVVQGINLQKSNYGESYYLNIGISPIDLVKTKHIAVNKFHLRMRYEDICLQQDNRKALNLEDLSMNQPERVVCIKAILHECLKFLDRVNDTSKLRSEIMENQKMKNRAVAELRTFLKI